MRFGRPFWPDTPRAVLSSPPLLMTMTQRCSLCMVSPTEPHGVAAQGSSIRPKPPLRRRDRRSEPSDVPGPDSSGSRLTTPLPVLWWIVKHLFFPTVGTSCPLAKGKPFCFVVHPQGQGHLQPQGSGHRRGRVRGPEPPRAAPVGHQYTFVGTGNAPVQGAQIAMKGGLVR